MAIEVRDNPQAERFEATVDGAPAGFAQYRLHGSHITMFHTEIDPAFEGQGVGSELARRALASVSDRGLELLPTCPFIAGYIAGHREYLELVAPALREKVASA